MGITGRWRHANADGGPLRWLCSLYPNVEKAGGLESQGVKGEAVFGYRDPLTTRVADPVEDGDLKSSSFPGR